MGAYADVTALNGLFKEVYGDDIIKLVPDEDKIVKAVPFVESEKQEGNQYHQPVLLSYEQGVTYAAGNAGAFLLNASIALQMKDAAVLGAQILLRSALPYDACAKASTSKKAFAKATELVVENMLDSATKRLELAYLYGQTNLGLVASSTQSDHTTVPAVMTLAGWGGGIWIGMEGAQLDLLHTDGTTVLNTNAALVVKTVDLATRTITLTGNATDIDTFDSEVAAHANLLGLVPHGTWPTTSTPQEFAGIDKILTNTGTIFGISASDYALWKSNTCAVSGALTFGKVLSGLVPAITKGLKGDLTLFVSPKTWADLADDMAALRAVDNSYKSSRVDVGSEEITYFYQGGKITIVSHLYIKEGEAFALPLKRMKRLGAQDLSFKTPGRPDTDLFVPLSDRAGFELRVYTDQCCFIERPGWCTKFTGIVNSL